MCLFSLYWKIHLDLNDLIEKQSGNFKILKQSIARSMIIAGPLSNELEEKKLLGENGSDDRDVDFFMPCRPYILESIYSIHL